MWKCSQKNFSVSLSNGVHAVRTGCGSLNVVETEWSGVLILPQGRIGCRAQYCHPASWSFGRAQSWCMFCPESKGRFLPGRLAASLKDAWCLCSSSPTCCIINYQRLHVNSPKNFRSMMPLSRPISSPLDCCTKIGRKWDDCDGDIKLPGSSGDDLARIIISDNEIPAHTILALACNPGVDFHNITPATQPPRDLRHTLETTRYLDERGDMRLAVSTRITNHSLWP